MKPSTKQRNLFEDAKQLSLLPSDAPQAKSFWDEVDVIHTYSRLQAIEDGVLVQLSGPGYEGDTWVPKMVAEAGFTTPVAFAPVASS